ncbi:MULTISPECIES: bifunctional nuclease family protein [unclassified Isoptericola]|uniref:bifunctional nuclease family protein n=1 Tax=unclassified Isoptericola TaxID=2623355 RepID=UPI002712229E|nr:MULTISPECIES: bifunctional nuclease family protein [unclassified Isoptericola]MDO8144798.1 bifunctional nuclease family protein [Isoptericola sp. 178]MDO8149578.1 bifunctional nuclease family protein [Isoptericola sp. b515]MDO8152512.1 bifunctional nuclease family protein [Isoptericola sp. b408]
MVPVEVLGVRQQQNDQEIVVLLLDTSAELAVPIVIGAREASAIAMAQAGVATPRPMTHDLLRDLLTAVGVELERVEIVALDGGIFFAELVLSNGTRLDSRASDAIALAVRTGSPVLCSAEVVAAAGVEIVDLAQQREVEKFRDFLDHVNPEDFTNPESGDDVEDGGSPDTPP